MKIPAYSGTYIESPSTVRTIFNQDDVLSHSIRGRVVEASFSSLGGPFSKLSPTPLASLGDPLPNAWRCPIPYPRQITMEFFDQRDELCHFMLRDFRKSPNYWL
jgi:hypothetical protein